MVFRGETRFPNHNLSDPQGFSSPKPSKEMPTNLNTGEKPFLVTLVSNSQLQPSLVKELAIILAEILIEDFQRDRQITVGSAPQTDRNAGLKFLSLVKDDG